MPMSLSYPNQFPCPQFFGDISSLMIGSGEPYPTNGLQLTTSQAATLGEALDSADVRGASAPNYKIRFIQSQKIAQATFQVQYVPGANANYIEIYPFVGLTPFAMVNVTENEGTSGSGLQTAYPLVWKMTGASTSVVYSQEFALPASAMVVGIGVKEFASGGGVPVTYGDIIISGILS